MAKPHRNVTERCYASTSRRAPRSRTRAGKPSAFQRMYKKISATTASNYGFLVTAICLIVAFTFLLPDFTQRINENNQIRQITKDVRDISERICRVESNPYYCESICLVDKLVNSSRKIDNKKITEITAKIFENMEVKEIQKMISCILKHHTPFDKEHIYGSGDKRFGDTRKDELEEKTIASFTYTESLDVKKR